MPMAVVIIADASPAFAGTIIVVVLRAISFHAATYCSATRRAAASLPALEVEMASLSDLMPSAVALARSRMDAASPSALRMAARRLPSAMFTSLCLSPSLCRTSARRLRSASACISMACLMDCGGTMSRISYLRTWMPHSFAAALTINRMAAFVVSRSSKVLSRLILPISERIVVCASCMTAAMGSLTPYEAWYASTTRRKITPSMLIVTLSFVIADWLGIGMASSFRECEYAIRSANGIRRCTPGSSNLWNLPKRSTT
mmetsp:Transcript_789/g.2212  ORF Transcript_789/g.2212 Transcript_789/m.2212 type:complete len:259 (+) Transcript_789:204-980(+)